MRRDVTRSLLALAATAIAAALGAGAGAPSARAATRPTAVDAPTRTVHVAGGLTLGYRSIGSGRPVVLIQGLSGSMDGWDPSFLDALAAAGHRVVVFDNEGIGRSTMRPGTLSIRSMGDDAAALIRALRLRRPDVIGWSMGGMIAQSLAVRHPASLRRLVLLATAPGDGKAVPPLPDALALLSGQDANPAALLGFLFPPGHAAAQTAYIGHIAARRGFAPLAPPAVIAAQTAASGVWMAGGDRSGRRISRLRMPVLVGGGALDHLLPVGNQRRLAKVIPRARLVVYGDAAHAFYLQHARTFGPRLARFLRR
jgi:pimeloyl-ACP methyl ester carboxylesterase